MGIGPSVNWPFRNKKNIPPLFVILIVLLVGCPAETVRNFQIGFTTFEDLKRTGIMPFEYHTTASAVTIAIDKLYEDLVISPDISLR